MTAEVKPTQAIQLHAAQFAQFMRLVALMATLIGGIEMGISFLTTGRPLFLLGAGTFSIGLTALAAYWLTHHRQQPGRGVYVWVAGSSLIAGLGLSLAVRGVATAIMALAAMNTLMVALLLPHHMLKQLAPWLIFTTLASTALERWAPWPRLDLMAELFLIPLILNPLSFSFVVYLTNLLSGTTQRALESSQAYARQLEQSQALLLDRTRELEAFTVNLQQRSEELERMSLQWQTISQQAERRARQLTASTQVARVIGQVRDLDQLLSQVTHLIGEAFGYYHVGIFTLDEIGRFAVLRAANSEGGQRMLARGHKLAVGAQGLVGYVASTGQNRIAMDVGQDAVHFDNPDLPNTRSEMAVPLRVGEQIFGVLDVQSTEEAAFTEEDVAILSALADQIAVAIENARLFEQTRAALQEAHQVQQRYLRQEWERLMPLLETTAYEYHISGVPPAGEALWPEMVQALQTGQVVATGPAPVSALAVPIKLGEHPIGVIDLHELDPEREWSEEEVALVTAVADQAALALENARLFAQTQQRAQREQLIARLTANVRAAPDVEGVLRTTVHQVRRALGATHGVIRLGLPPTESTDEGGGS